MSLRLIVLLSLAEVVGDFQLKSYARTRDLNSLYIGLAGYAAVIFFLIQALKSANVLYVNGMWDGVSALIETLLAIIILKETLNSNAQYAGIGFIVLGIFMLHSGGPKA
jgi:multidrug transporter EmrE-like cation transporter